MSMIPYDLHYCDYLLELVLEGSVSEERLDDAVFRTLKMKQRLDLWNLPVTKPSDYPKFGSAEHEALALAAAQESITLLKNDNQTLPLSIQQKVLVVGPNADSMRVLDGGWSYSWQGNQVPYFAWKYDTIQAALKKKAAAKGDASAVNFVQAVKYNDDGLYWEDYRTEDYDDLGGAVDQADVIVLAVGENSYTEKPGDLQDLGLAANQTKLLTDLIAFADGKKPIVLVMSGGRPRIIGPLIHKVSAMLELYLPGNFGGNALADILYGDVNPSGRLPYTYPLYPHALVNYWHKPSEEVQSAEPKTVDSDFTPMFEFAHGLSYSTFEYSNVRVVPASTWNPATTPELTVTVNVHNRGPYDGQETVLLFTSDLYASTTPDVKRLRKFQKIALRNGVGQDVTFKLTWQDLSFINIDNQRVTEAGDFIIRIGSGAGLEIPIKVEGNYPAGVVPIRV